MADMKTNAPADFYFQKSHYSPFVHGWKGWPSKNPDQTGLSSSGTTATKNVDLGPKSN